MKDGNRWDESKIGEQKYAEGELVQAKDLQYRTLLENLPQKVFLKDRNSVFISCNRNYAKDLKIRPEEIAGKTDYDFFPAKLAEKYRSDDKRIMESGKTENIEEEYVVVGDCLGDSSTVFINTVKVPILGKAGNVIGIFGLFWDITERKKTEEALRESENKFRVIIESSNDGIIFCETRTKKIDFANDAMARLLGRSKKEIVTMTVQDLHHKDDWGFVEKEFERHVSGEESVSDNIPVVRKDGSIFFADITSATINIDGERHFVAFFRDVTERKRSEKELARYRDHLEDLVKERTAALQISEANYKSIFELASDAIMIRDIETYRTVDANTAACEMFGYPKEEMLTLYIKDFMTNRGPYTWEDAKHFYEKAAKDEPQLFEWLAVDKAGTTFWVEATIKRAIIGNKYRLISILRDITERKRLAGMKDSFINSVSHELRTPLTAIKEGVSIVFEEVKGKVGKKNRDILEIVTKNVDRLNRLIGGVLDFQKLEAGIVVFRPKRYDINDIVMECYKTMSDLACEKNIKLSTDLTKKIPKAVFDKDRILQVLMNLVNNAIKFTKKGRIVISTNIERNAVKVSVSDTGIGIRFEDIPKVFQKFWRGEDVPGAKTAGTGLGLAISKEIVEKHGGKIWVESKWGKGTAFHFVLPLKRSRG